MLSQNKKLLPLCVVLTGVAFFTIISIYVPLLPSMPTLGLDPSWVISLNQAVAQKLSFGTELIYTFGPYAALWTHQYHPATDHLAIYTGLYFSTCFLLCFTFVFNIKKWILGILILLILMLTQADVGFFFYAFMVSLFSFKLNYQDEIKIKNAALVFYAAIIFSAFGLMFLIKATFFLIFVPITLLSAVLFFLNKRKGLAVTIFFSPMVAVFFFWALAGQTGSLATYLAASIAIVSGYSDAMSLSGPNLEVFAFFISAVLLLMSIFTEKTLPLNARYFLAICFSLFLFLSFKEGFVRHDAHALVAGYSLLVMTLCLFLVVSMKRSLVMISFILGIVSSFFIIHPYQSLKPRNVFSSIENHYVATWQGLSLRLHEPNALKSRFENNLLSLRQQAQFPVWHGTTDIYSFNQALLIASGNIWFPRPIFQSYQAYTSELATRNKAHLLDSNAPQHVVFKVETIDGRLPALEDGASWPLLLSLYKLNKTEVDKNGYLYLSRKKECHFVGATVETPEKAASMNTWVNLPVSTKLIYVSVDIQPSLLGKIAELLYKRSKLIITIKLNDNSERQYRLIAGMSQSGFIISPLVENTDDFRKFFGGNIETEKTVKSIKISTGKIGSLLWNPGYRIRFSVFTPEQLIQCSSSR